MSLAALALWIAPVFAADFPTLTVAKRCKPDAKGTQVCEALADGDTDFDPDGFRPLFTEEGQNDRLLLLVKTGNSAQACTLNVKITRKVPKCTLCQNDCYKLKKNDVRKKTYEVPGEKNKSLVIDLGADLVDTWYLIGLRLDFELECGKDKKSIGHRIPGWAWCA